jgi:hypothetical protein
MAMPEEGRFTSIALNTIMVGSRRMTKKILSSIIKKYNQERPASHQKLQCDIAGLSKPFMEEEVKVVVKNTCN